MSITRSLTKEFKIHSPIMGVPRSAYQSGTLKTRDKALIAMLRRLPPNRVEEVIDAPEVDPEIAPVDLGALSWHDVQKLGSEKGVLKTGMDREAIETALGEVPE